MKANTRVEKSKKEDNNLLAEAIVETEEKIGGLRLPDQLRKRLKFVIERKRVFLAGAFLIVANTLANVLNFIFSAYVGRQLSLSDFALVSLMSSLYSFSALFFGPFSSTVNYRSSFLIGKFNDEAGYKFWKYIRKYGILIGLAISLLWLAASPFLNAFFQTSSFLFFVSFTAIIFGGFAAGTDKGFLMARLFFIPLALVIFLEPVIKMLLAILLVWVHDEQLMYITIPLSFFVSFFFGWLLIINQKPKPQNINYTKKDVTIFPDKFFFVSLLSGLSTLSFASLDIVLAKHYLLPNDAGKYALVSLMGKTVFFLGGLTTPFVIPLISRDLGANKDTTRMLYLLLFSTFTFCFIGFICFGVFGYITAPLLLGEKAEGIISYLPLFLFAMMCFCVSQIFATFYQIRKMYSFPLVGFLLSILQIVLIVINHSTIFSIVFAMSLVGIINLIMMSLMHFQWRKVQAVEKKVIDLYQRRMV